ncbi:hypothetical protein JN535_04730 [Cellulosimicrobium cellulans]|uniref:hypothetical protein n=1 Tax=Cellulosimicrobium cellulans TaxID=1710 RepID=UPI0019637D52|nr:hypothetical protein [Cellulosimicrobium cellulans]MBN0039480.1 hypothetical protein [Cellulosimicrobium cellulans]
MTTWTDHEVRAYSLLRSATTLMKALDRIPPDDRIHQYEIAAGAMDELQGAMAYAQAVQAHDEGALDLVGIVWPDVVGSDR